MGLGSGIQDPGFGKKPIPDPGSRGQKGTGSRLIFSELKFGRFVLLISGILNRFSIKPVTAFFEVLFFYHSCGSTGSIGSAYRCGFRILILLRQK
jgi:hypothetical protein